MKILITGGCGYVGSRLVPYLLAKGHKIRVLDSLVFGNNIKDFNFELIEGDICDEALCDKATKDIDAVIHLAAISNDPTAELKPETTKRVNLDAIITLTRCAKKNGVKRLILASSSTLYGFKEGDVFLTEEDELVPLTLYGKYKAEGENASFALADENFTVVSLRPGTVCGFSLRQRFDLIVNIFTNHALSNGKLIIEGGKQKRPIIHILDMCRAYEAALHAPAEKVNKQAFNVVGENMTIEDIAKRVAELIPGTEITYVDKTDDRRSYFTSSDKIKKVLGFSPKLNMADAVKELCNKFEDGYFKDTMADSRFFNIKTLKELEK
ncbi:NAD(P)-dependent oxidoreductase [Candidatus Woesearchaeota archaeon]|nr:NAD(P)-dependent oxidoreductase [Candidatus Woesearchaeota archaeon]